MVQIPGVPTSQRRPRVAAPTAAELGTGGDILGPALETVGAGLEVAGQAIRKQDRALLEEQQKRDAAAFRIKGASDFTVSQNQKFEELKTSTEDINTFSDSFLSKFDEDANLLLQAAPNELARAETAEKIGRLREGFALKAIDFQSSEKIALQRADTEAALDGLMSGIVTNPDEFANILGDVQESIDIAGQFLTPSEKRELEDDTLEVAFETKLQAEINRGNLEGARELIQDDSFQEILGPEKIEAFNEEVLKLVEEDIDATRVQDAFEGRVALDARNRDDKEAVDVFWKKFKTTLEGTPQEQLNQTTDFIARVGVFPTPVLNTVNASLQNGSVNEKVTAADLIEQVAEKNLTATIQVRDTDRARARAIVENIEAGLSPENAVNYAENSVFNKDTIEYKQRITRFKDESRSFNESDFTEFFRDDPDEVPAGMEADYNRLNRVFYLDEGVSASSAQILANEAVKKQWKPTRVDGTNRWMKFAPEAVYDNGTDPEWMSEQFDEDTKGLLPENAKKDKNLFLSVNPDSIRQQDPNYIVNIKDDNGIITPLIDEAGRLVLWRPDWKTSPEFKRKHEEGLLRRRDALAEGKRKRRGAQIKAGVQSIREGF